MEYPILYYGTHRGDRHWGMQIVPSCSMVNEDRMDSWEWGMGYSGIPHYDTEQGEGGGGTVWHFLSLPAQCYTEGQNSNTGQTLAIHVIITTKPARLTRGNPFLVYAASPL